MSITARSQMRTPELASWVALVIYSFLGIIYCWVPTSAPCRTAPLVPPEGVSGGKGQPCSEKPQRAETAGQRAKGTSLGSASAVPPAVSAKSPPASKPAALMSLFKDKSRIIALLSSPYTTHTHTHTHTSHIIYRFIDGQEALLEVKEAWTRNQTLRVLILAVLLTCM